LSWTSPADLRAQLSRRWERGDLLRACVGEAVDWPLRLALKSPSAADLADRFEEVRAWAELITRIPRVRVEWRERNHRVQGLQRLPAAIWVDTLEDALAWLGKAEDARRFRACWAQTAAELPEALPWLGAHPLQALALADSWSRLLAVVRWVQAHPRPGVYLRQVDVPGVDSKFIEAHRGVLSGLLDLALLPPVIDAAASGAAQFTRRYGFLDKPARVRFRLLDASIALLPGPRGSSDLTLDADSFAGLVLPVERVFVTENETNFLTFPPVERSLVIFGAGYGWDALAGAGWLHRCALFYWGDIDTHGFAILDQLRCHFPHAVSLLMDRATLLAHEVHWGTEREPLRRDLPRLTVDESALYDDLRAGRPAAGVRLEQERVGYGWLQNRLRALGLPIGP
jgi:hypothetical protein